MTAINNISTNADFKAALLEELGLSNPEDGVTPSEMEAAIAEIFTPSFVYVNNKGYTVSATTTETTALTFTIPANKMGANGIIQIFPVYSTTNDGHAKYFKIKFNNIKISEISSVSNAAGKYEIRFWNVNNAAINKSFNNGATAGGLIGSTTLALSDYTINTASDITVTVTIQNGSTDDTSVLESILVLVYKNNVVY